MQALSVRAQKNSSLTFSDREAFKVLQPSNSHLLRQGKRFSHSPVCLDVQCVDRMTTGHVKPVILGSSEGQIRAALRKSDEADRISQCAEYLDPIKIFGLTLELEHFP